MLGCDPRKSPLALYHELRGELPEIEDSEVLREGREFESAITRIAQWKFGVSTVIDPNAPSAPTPDLAGCMIPAIAAGSLSGHPDRFVLDELGAIGVAEVKQTFLGGGGQDYGDGGDEVPRRHWLQSMVYQGLMREVAKEFGRPICDHGMIWARLHGGVKQYVIPFDREVYAALQHEATTFLARVHNGDPPTPRDEADMRSRWLVNADKTVVATSEIEAAAVALANTNATIKGLEKQASDLKTILLGYAQDAASIVRADGQVLADLKANREFDVMAFIAENPTIAMQFQKLDVSAAKKAHAKVCERYMRVPTSALDQTRTIRLKIEGGE